MDNKQISPDGRWQWDGQRWVPTQPAGAPPPSRRKRWPFVVGGGIALVVLMGICTVALSAGGKPAAPVAKATVPPAQTARATTVPVVAATPARDGSCSPQPCANDNYGWVVVVDRVQYDAAGDSFGKPEAGNVFVQVDVTFTNALAREQHANPSEFVLQDGFGVKHAWKPFLDGPCVHWDPVNLVKGGSLGPKCLSFEAAAGKPSPLVLHWTPSGFGGGYDIKLS